MAVVEAVQRLLLASDGKTDLKAAYNAIVHNLETPGSHRGCLESLVVCAENALSVSEQALQLPTHVDTCMYIHMYMYIHIHVDTRAHAGRHN